LVVILCYTIGSNWGADIFICTILDRHSKCPRDLGWNLIDKSAECASCHNCDVYDSRYVYRSDFNDGFDVGGGFSHYHTAGL